MSLQGFPAHPGRLARREILVRRILLNSKRELHVHGKLLSLTVLKQHKLPIAVHGSLVIMV